MRKNGRKIKALLLMMLFVFCIAKSNGYAAEMTKVITGFEEFDINENALHLLIEYKPSLEEMKEMLPDTLGVYLDYEEEVVELEVDWFCVAEDYEESDNFYFQFSPSWDENEYQLSEDISLLLDAPYIGVFFTTEEQAVSTYAVTNNSNEEKIFNYLIEKMGYNTAAACGVMANLYCESAFIPTNLENFYESRLGFTDASYTYAVDTGKYKNFVRDAAGYGLCQWTYWTRKQGLLDQATAYGTSIGDLYMQLDFMKKELSGTAVDSYARAVPDNAGGAYKVGYYYCEKFERPAQKEDEVSIVRGNLAQNKYWPEYKDYLVRIEISGQNVPDTMSVGTSFSVKGTISANVAMSNVTAGVYNRKGTMLTGVSINPNAESYNLANKASSIAFQKLNPGIYTYKVSAKGKDKVVTLVDQKFIVLGNSASINNGIYMLESKGNKNLVLDVKDHSKTSGTKFSLAYKENTDYQFFEITHVGNGYYTLKNVASGKYVEVTGAAAANSTFLQQNDKNNGSSQKWQIISAEDGYYWFVPECAKKFCLNLQNNGKTENSYAQIYSPTFSEGQQIKLIKGEMKEIFTDVKSYNWFYDYVGYVYKNNLMSGNAYEGLFNPNTAVTRGQVITTIYRLAGSPKVKDYKACSVFSDVEKDKYYTDAVCWAYNEGITTGNPDTGKFNTTASITRQQLATFFFRYAELAGYEINKRADLSSMLNADQVKNYAKEAMEWAVAADLISGSETTDASGKVTYDLKPNGTATRAQLAAILYRFCYYNDL